MKGCAQKAAQPNTERGRNTMKKIIALVLVLAMMLPSAFAMTAGTYEAAAPGFHGDVKVAVTVDADKIVDIVVTHTETEGIGSVALPKLVEEVKKNQTINVDDVSGATISYHLKTLKQAELVTEHKEKNFVFYELNTSVFEEVMLWFSQFGGNNNEA